MGRRPSRAANSGRTIEDVAPVSSSRRTGPRSVVNVNTGVSPPLALSRGTTALPLTLPPAKGWPCTWIRAARDWADIGAVPHACITNNPKQTDPRDRWCRIPILGAPAQAIGSEPGSGFTLHQQSRKHAADKTRSVADPAHPGRTQERHQGRQHPPKSHHGQ